MANTKVTTGVIKDDAVGADQLASNSVVTASIVDNAITTAKINNDAILTAKISNSAITNAKMSANSVDSDQYVDGSIDTAHIGDGQITSAKLDTNISVSGELTVGSHLNMGDGDILKMGAGDDLQIYHDGSHSYIDELVTGDLRIRSNSAVALLKSSDNADMLVAIPDGAVTLYYAGSAKLATTSSGIDVTGTAVTDGLTATGVIVTEGDAALNDAQIGRLNFTNTNSNASANPIRASILSGRQNSAWGGYLSLYTSTGTDAASEKVRIDETGNVGIRRTSIAQPSSGATTLAIQGTDNNKAGAIRLYSANDSVAAYIYPDSVNGLSINTSTNHPMVFRTAGGERMRINAAGGLSINDNLENPLNLNRTTTTTGASYMKFTNGGGNYYIGADSSAGDRMAIGGLAYGFTMTAESGRPLVFATSNIARMAIDSSGNVGIATAAPNAPLTIQTESGTGSKAGLRLNNPFGFNDLNTGAEIIFSQDRSSSEDYKMAAIISGQGSAGSSNEGYLKFFTRNGGTIAEKMRITSVGSLLVGKTVSNVANDGQELRANGETFHTIASANNTLHVYSSTASAYRFYVSHAGQINATSTSINAISDKRLKENIVDLETGLSEVMSLQPRRFDWKNGDGENVAGFIAQEVETVLPDLISDYKHEELKDAKSVRMGDMIPTLVKAIQEQQTQIETLKAEIQELKG